MAGPAYQWGRWRFEPTECRLLRDGEVVPLPAKTLDLLATLLRRAPRLVTKEEILAGVWPDAAVEEGNIAFHVAALRKVLDEEGETSAIETVRGKGYRFVHTVVIHQLPATDDLRHVVQTLPGTLTAPATRRTGRFAWPALLVAAAIIVAGSFAWVRSQGPPPSIAVQPFEIVTPGAGQENFPDGLGSYLISRLDLAGVTVTSRDAATAVLSGQLQPTPSGFRVTVQLTSTADNTRVWDWSFDESADNGRPAVGLDDERSRVQGNIAGRVAEGVQRYLSLSGAVPVTR